MNESLRRLNEAAIKDGLLLPDGQYDQVFHTDGSKLLGVSLSAREERAYRLIFNHNGPITTEELAREIYPEDFKAGLEVEAKNSIWVLISSLIKMKLGETAIISCGPKKGYVARRALINQSVPKRN